MSINLITQKEHELIVKAKNSRCSSELRDLSKNPFSNVRRCVAKNSSTPKNVVEELIFDPVANVSYIARQNTSSNYFKQEEHTSKCVLCKKDETTFIYACARC